jgi:hypothetical protein
MLCGYYVSLAKVLLAEEDGHRGIAAGEVHLLSTQADLTHLSAVLPCLLDGRIGAE